MTPQTEANLIDTIANAIAGALGPLSRFTKAIVPSATLEVTALVNWLVAGSFNAVSITAAASGLVAGLLGYLLPNKTSVQTVPVPVPVTPVVKKSS